MDFVRFSDARVLIFAKAPVPGACKSRLIPTLGPRGAARVAERLLCDTVERLGAAPLAPVELWCAPDATHPLFQRMGARFGLRLAVQHGEHLGARMQHAMAEALGTVHRAVLVGTDCPDLDRDYLGQGLAALDDHPAVLGPAEDGGYVLLGLRRDAASSLPCLFDGVPWGTDLVAEATRLRLQRSGLRWAELPVLADIDRPEDLARDGLRTG